MLEFSAVSLYGSLLVIVNTFNIRLYYTYFMWSYVTMALRVFIHSREY